MEGIERLEKQVIEMNDPSVTRIFDYLKTRKDLYEKFNNEEKTMSEMYKFLFKKAEKHKINRVAIIDDNLVYLWAITYFSRSNKDLGLEGEKSTPTADKKEDKKLQNKIDQEEKSKDVTSPNQITLFEEVQK